jgi:hypothetical protein
MARLPNDPFEAAKAADNPFQSNLGTGWGVPSTGTKPVAMGGDASPANNPFATTAPGGDFGPPPQGNFDPGGGGGSGGWGDYYYNQDPYAGLAAFEQGRGIEATGAFGRFLSNQSNNLNAGYGAATATPGQENLNRLDYYQQQLPSLTNWFGVSQAANYSPFRRGR